MLTAPSEYDVTIRVLVYTSADKTKYESQEYILHIVPLADELFVTLDRDPVGLNEITMGDGNKYFVGAVADDAKMTEVLVSSPTAGNQIRISRVDPTGITDGSNWNAWQNNQNVQEVTLSDSSSNGAGYIFNAAGYVEVPFQLQNTASMGYVTDKLIRIYRAKADPRLGKLFVTFDQDYNKVNPNDLINPKLYTANASYSATNGDYYVTVGNDTIDYAINVTAQAQQLNAKVLTITPDKEHAEKVRDGVDASDNNANTMVYVGAGGSTYIQLQDTITYFYIVVEPEDNGFAREMYTLVVVKLEPAITAGTISDNYVTPVNILVGSTEYNRDYTLTPATANTPAKITIRVAKPDDGKVDLVLRVNGEFTSVALAGNTSFTQPVKMSNTSGADYWKEGVDPSTLGVTTTLSWNDPTLPWYQVTLKDVKVDVSDGVNSVIIPVVAKSTAEDGTSVNVNYEVELVYAATGIDLLKVEDITNMTVTTDPMGNQVESNVVMAQEIKDHSGKLLYYRLVVKNAIPTNKITLRATAALQGSIVTLRTVNTQNWPLASNDRNNFGGTYPDPSDKHVVTDQVTLTADITDYTRDGQWVFARVVDESGKEGLYNIHIVRAKDDLEVKVKASEKALTEANDLSKAGNISVQPSGSSPIDTDYYVALFSATSSGANMSVTANYAYTKVAILTNESFAYTAPINVAKLTALANLMSMPNLGQTSDPWKLGKDEKTMTFTQAQKEALDNGGLYVPYYVQSEAGTVTMGFILLQRDMTDGALSSIEARFEWPEGSGTERIIPAELNKGDDKDKYAYVIELPQDLKGSTTNLPDIIVTPANPLIPYVLVDDDAQKNDPAGATSVPGRRPRQTARPLCATSVLTTRL